MTTNILKLWLKLILQVLINYLFTFILVYGSMFVFWSSRVIHAAQQG